MEVHQTEDVSSSIKKAMEKKNVSMKPLDVLFEDKNCTAKELFQSQLGKR